jgi:glutathione S-transferase
VNREATPVSHFQLAIANKAYSSWSLRAWLYLKESGIPFEEVRVPLYTPEWDARIGGLSPSGRLPALKDGDLLVWDSWAIMDHAQARCPAAVGWPEDRAARATALSASAEMHSGFSALREEMPFNCRRRVPGLDFSAPALEDAERVREIWRHCRSRFGGNGPWLFGEFCRADVLYAPIVLRFETYGIPLDGLERAYAESVLALAQVREWVAGAEAEEEVLEDYERRA